MGRFRLEDDSDDEKSATEETAAHVVSKWKLVTSSNVNSNARHNAASFDQQDSLQRNSNGNSVNQIYSGGDHLENRPRQAAGYRKHSITCIIMCIALQHYMPPPLPPFETWTEYVSHSIEGLKGTILNLAILAGYIASGLFHNMQQDGKSKIHSILSGTEVNLPCPIALPKSTDSFDAMEAIQSRIMGRIIGQNLAIESISRSLASWEWKSGMDDEKDYVAKRPLSMIFTGPPGVGKYETAKQVADMILHRCQIESFGPFGDHLHCGNPLCNRDNSDRILHLSGMEYALDEESYGRALIQQILDHIYSQKNAGSIIIIKHVENISKAAKSHLVRLLSKRNVAFTPTYPLKESSFGSMFGMKHDSKTEKKVDLRLNSSIFLLTTDLGTDKIISGLKKHINPISGLRKYIFQAPALLDAVQAEVEMVVKQYFGAEVSQVSNIQKMYEVCATF